jgi:hypothetical protein
MFKMLEGRSSEQLQVKISWAERPGMRCLLEAHKPRRDVRQEADAAERVPVDRKSIKKRFFRNHHHLQVKGKESEANSRGEVAKQTDR